MINLLYNEDIAATIVKKKPRRNTKIILTKVIGGLFSTQRSEIVIPDPSAGSAKGI